MLAVPALPCRHTVLVEPVGHGIGRHANRRTAADQARDIPRACNSDSLRRSTSTYSRSYVSLTLTTEPAHLLPTMGCPTALLAAARIAVAGDSLVLVPATGGDPIQVVWPTGWAAWRLDGRAELVSRDGGLVGREGDVVSGFGGGIGADDAFHVCVAGG